MANTPRVVSAIFILISLAACGGTQGSDISVTDAWVRPVSGVTAESSSHVTPQAGTSDTMSQHTSSATGPVTAAYMTLTNKGNAPDRLVRVDSSVAGLSEVHVTKDMGGGMMGMQPVQGGLEVPANGSVALKPGGYHIMMMSLRHDLKAGDSITMSLTFQSGKVLALTVPVRQQP